MTPLLPDTLRTLRRLAMQEMAAAELAEWLAVHLPSLWDSGIAVEQYVLSELSLALERVERHEAGPEFLAERAITLAREVGPFDITAPNEIVLTFWVGTADNMVRTTGASYQTIFIQAPATA